MILRRFFIFLHLISGLCGGFGQELSNNDEDAITFVDEHSNVTLPCYLHSNSKTEISTYWVEEGKHWSGEHVLSNGSLFLTNVTRQKTGRYTCLQEENDRVIYAVHLVVRGPPDPPENVTISTSTVIAVVMWHLHLEEDWENSPEGPKTTLHLRYRPLHSEAWLHLPHHIPPSQSRLEVYKLQPNTTYEFELWTSNVYGKSEVVSVITTTHPYVSEKELAKMLEETLEEFSPSVWIVAVVVVMVVANVLGGLLLVIYYFQHKFKKSGEADKLERIELVPHIIENPGYQVEHSQNHETIHESPLSPSTSAQSTAAVV
ncbi:contactin-4 isoform X2 [Panulirus ornatus]|uniref:contactin-4 isoform X2 n=1 Tax=Panulirus ornatus TaxID=150431 RepID=UPI003A88E904